MRPILFNTEMVRAILDGRKIVTRRIVKPQPPPTAIVEMTDRYAVWKFWADDPSGHLIKPPYNPGDILYVRETWCKGKVEYGEIPDGRCVPFISQCIGEDDIIPKEWAIQEGIGVEDVIWKPSIHMPKEYARLFLRVKHVSVERLQDIDCESIRAEGMDTLAAHVGDIEIAKLEFAMLWDTTIKPSDQTLYGWDANPWVWVIEFERCKKPVEGDDRK